MPRPGSDGGRWKSKFARFIKFYGVESLAVQLDVKTSAIYHWVRGVSAPRRTHAEIIKRLAPERGCPLKMDAINEHARAVVRNRAGDLDAIESRGVDTFGALKSERDLRVVGHPFPLLVQVPAIRLHLRPKPLRV